MWYVRTKHIFQVKFVFIHTPQIVIYHMLFLTIGLSTYLRLYALSNPSNLSSHLRYCVTEQECHAASCTFLVWFKPFKIHYFRTVYIVTWLQ